MLSDSCSFFCHLLVFCVLHPCTDACDCCCVADENPRNVGSLPKDDKNVGTGLVGAPACGDVMKLQIRVDDEGKITEAKFKTFGCGSAIVCGRAALD